MSTFIDAHQHMKNPFTIIQMLRKISINNNYNNNNNNTHHHHHRRRHRRCHHHDNEKTMKCA